MLGPRPAKLRIGKNQCSSVFNRLATWVGCSGARGKRARLTLAQVADATGLSTRFLSEFERGKENASVGRVLHAFESLGLDVVVLPRGEAQRILSRLESPPSKAR